MIISTSMIIGFSILLLGILLIACIFSWQASLGNKMVVCCKNPDRGCKCIQSNEEK